MAHAKARNFLGIDPGVYGALVLISEDGARLNAWDMPAHRIKKGKTVKTRVDLGGIDDLVALLSCAGVTRAVLEDVGGRPGQGAPAAFSFGRSAGAVEMALVSFRVPYTLVPPATWMSRFKLKGRDPDGAIACACQNLPAHRRAFTVERGAVTHKAAEGRADAALMALYARDVLSA